MKLSVFKRATGKKGEIKQIRREGNVIGVLYGNNQKGQPIYLRGEEFQAILRNMRPGLLSTTVFELHDGQHKYKAIIKDIQYHVTSYQVMHVDFLLLDDKVPVNVNVPIQITGAAECAGVKLGGFLRQVIRTLKVSCLPKFIPHELSVDVRDLAIAQSKTLGDIVMPEHVRPLAKLSEVAVVVGKKA